MTVPAAEGFRMPAEWAPHKRCWMAWPCRKRTWGDGLDAAREAYAHVAQEIAAFEPVVMVCPPEDVAEASLACGTGIEVLPVDIDDSWVRDTGPSFVLGDGGRLAGVDWQYNAWGEIYQPFDKDAVLAARLCERIKVPRFPAPLVLEGGAIHVDGEGTVLATESSILNPNRNPGLDREAAEQILRDYLGIAKVIWLTGGLEDDDTDGHVDNVACFAAPGVVLALVSEDPSDGNFAVLEDNLARLRRATDARGRSLRVATVPQPARQMRNDRRLPLSHLNFYIANGAVIAPSFAVPEDDRAFRVLKEAFPRRTIVVVSALDIVVGGGGIHCITQQEPAT
ncbi:MAG: agmatine deiminase [Alphaproteobacteria bacterium]|jgi:agmatine deiminase|nr:agmatine deiminase [Alphaproteobacteria bacterium]